MRVHANGRVRRSRSEWREIFDRFEASGLSQTEFCRRESIAKGTFSRWMKVLLCGTPCARVRWNAASLKIVGGGILSVQNPVRLARTRSAASSIGAREVASVYARRVMRPRVALVLGGGGVAGGAFHAGVLAALATSLRWDARDAELIVGTSAGSMTGAMLRAGLPPGDLLSRATGERISDESQEITGRIGPPVAPPEWRPSWRPGTAFWPRRRWRLGSSWADLTSLLAIRLPEGRTPSKPITEMIDSLFGDWPERGFWVCAVRLEDGQRVGFGRDHVEGVSVGRAVAASCAIPGVFVPVEIGAERYIDGGARSMTSVDVLAGYDCDLVIASSPMSAAAGDRWRIAFDVPMRRLLRAQLVREIEALGSGRRVITIEPTAAEQRVMGPNPMDVDKRAEISRAVYESTRRRLDGGDLSPLAELLGGR